MSIEVFRDKTVHNFLEHAGPLLYKNEPENSLMLGTCENLTITPPKTEPVLLRLLENGVTVSAAIQTPPLNLILTSANRLQVETLAHYLTENNLSVPGVAGPAAVAEAFAEYWSQLNVKTHHLGMSQKLYKLEKVNFPPAVNGEFEVVSQHKLNMVTAWLMAFAKESLPESERRDENAWREYAQRMINNKHAHFWTVNKNPVAVACASRPTANGMSVSFVYTAPEFRKNGYASALVAQLSQKILNMGMKFCVLYTDVTNPSSNKIYQTLGYSEISESRQYCFK
jgi:uncharacterized protein